MARGGSRVGSGRPKKGCERPALPERSECLAVLPSDVRTPLEHMLTIMNDPGADDARRDRMAVAAAPFIHAKAGESGKKEEKERQAKVAGQGKFAAGAGPRLVVNNR